MQRSMGERFTVLLKPHSPKQSWTQSSDPQTINPILSCLIEVCDCCLVLFSLFLRFLVDEHPERMSTELDTRKRKLKIFQNTGNPHHLHYRVELNLSYCIFYPNFNGFWLKNHLPAKGNKNSVWKLQSFTPEFNKASDWNGANQTQSICDMMQLTLSFIFFIISGRWPWPSDVFQVVKLVSGWRIWTRGFQIETPWY